MASGGKIEINVNAPAMLNAAKRHLMAVHESGHLAALGDIKQDVCNSPYKSIMEERAICLTFHNIQTHDVNDIWSKY